jgi:hypothetical protein
MLGMANRDRRDRFGDPDKTIAKDIPFLADPRTRESTGSSIFIKSLKGAGGGGG